MHKNKLINIKSYQAVIHAYRHSEFAHVPPKGPDKTECGFCSDRRLCTVVLYRRLAFCMLLMRLEHLTFLQKSSECLRLKKLQLRAEKHPQSFVFFAHCPIRYCDLTLSRPDHVHFYDKP